jgi:hypothetical protein
MFPSAFADEVVIAHTQPGDLVLDPFAGRGTAIFSAARQGRHAVGIEINPVGYVYAQSKIAPASQGAVERRLRQIQTAAGDFASDAECLPPFFERCFSRSVRQFLLSARAQLDWRRRRTDRTLMAFLLIYLHGKSGAALSNQMRQTKAMSPQYATRWWLERNMDPPELDPSEFLRPRIAWRYAKGQPVVAKSRMYLDDSRTRLNALGHQVANEGLQRAKLLLTSPPYFGITNYHYDQWLRLWLLGGQPNALLEGNARAGKFESPGRYNALLDTVFGLSAALIRDDATVYVRTDAREASYVPTRRALLLAFPGKRLLEVKRPMAAKGQTGLFGGVQRVSGGDVDLILTPR